MTRWQRFLCVLLHWRHDFMWPHGSETGQYIVAACRNCGHVAVLPLWDLKPPKLRYAGVAEKHRLDMPASRRFRVLPMRRQG